jgi:rhamnulokinase
MVGGGIQNQLLCRFTANALGKPVWAGPIEASAIGNMLMQLVAIGDCKDLREARNLVAASFPIDVYEPSAEAGWSTAYETFLRFGRV